MKRLKIGIDLSRVAFGEPNAVAHWLRGALGALFARDTESTYVAFTTVFNYHQFPDPGPHVTRCTLSTQNYTEELQDRVTYEGDFDLLLRCYPCAPLARFPLARQVVCFAEWPCLPPGAGVNERRALRTYQTCGGALVVPNEAVRAALRADPWTTAPDVFVAPPGGDDDASWHPAADELRAGFRRAADRADRPARVRVLTPPVVSVVTPSFNQGAFIRQTIDSVLRQDYPHIEYRVIDGGSTDDTVEVLKSYGDRVKWVSEPDRGQTHAINKGLARATGEIRTYLNSDDLLCPGAVARVVDHFRDRPACDLVYGRDAMIDADGAYIKMYPTADYSFERLMEVCCISQPAAFWRKRLGDAVGPFDESLNLVMDYDYWMRADRAGGQLEHVPDVLAHTRIHREAKSSGAGKTATYAERFFRELFEISFRHAGYVSSHYVHLWLYTCVFNRNRWAREHADLIGHVCQQWYHLRFRAGWGRWAVARRLFGDLWWEATRRLLRPVVRRVRRLDPRRWSRPRPLPPVKLEPDLWLPPEFAVAHAGGPARLTGVPARDGVLRVYRGGAEVASVALRADEPADVCLDIPDPGPLRLSFSDSELLPDGRRAAFKLHGTTLFTARDVA